MANPFKMQPTTETYFRTLQAKLENLREQLRFQLAIWKLRARNIFCTSSIIGSNGPDVSLTTHGAREHTVFLTIESIAEGDLLPKEIILWVDSFELANNPPASLKRLIKRGLQVIPIEKKIGPHKKYYPYVARNSHFSRPMVTADDDVLYPKKWLSGLFDAFVKNSEEINCYRARRILEKDSHFFPYIDWPLCTDTSSSFQNFATGVSGVIYPPKFLEHLKQADLGFLEICPKADDIWLHVVAIRNNFKVKQISPNARTFPEVPNTQEQGLYHTNQFSSGNDEQIAKTYKMNDIRLIFQK